MERQTASRRTALKLVGGALVGLAGCGGGGDGAGDGQAQDETEMTAQGTATATGTEEGEAVADDAEEQGGDEGGDARLRAAHVSPDADSVSVTVGGEPFLDGVSFGTVTDYQSVQSGEQSVTVEPGDGGEPIFDGQVDLDSGPQTVVAFGEATADESSFDVTVLADDDSPAGSGSARVRVFHAIPNAQNVDITAGETVMAQDLTFGDHSAYVTITPDVDQIELRPAAGGEATPETDTGSDETPAGEDAEETETPTDGERTQAIATFSPDISEGRAYTLYASGYVDAGGNRPDAELLAAVDAAPEGEGAATGGSEDSGTETGGGTATDAGTETGTGTESA